MSRKGREILDNGLSKIDAFILSVRVDGINSLHGQVMNEVLNRTIGNDIRNRRYNEKITDLNLYEANVFAKYMN